MKKILVLSLILLCGFSFSAQPVFAQSAQYVPPPPVPDFEVFLVWWFFGDFSYLTEPVAYQYWVLLGRPY